MNQKKAEGHFIHPSAFILHPSPFAIVAQLAEHWFCKPAVTGSTPVDGFRLDKGLRQINSARQA
jgi:hypothetical protein